MIYADIVLGDQEGFVALAFGRWPYRDQAGKYTHKEWSETRFVWPAERDRMTRELQRELNSGEPVDIYICPAVRFTDRRRKGDALPPKVCWVDLDNDPADPELWNALQPYIVNSGQPGHRHAYVPLARTVDLGTHATLNKALTDRLGGDAKWSDESLLRVVGSFNHKTDPPTQITVEQADPKTWDPDKLANLLGADLDSPNNHQTGTETVEGEPVDLDKLPAWLTKRLRAPAKGNDRSEAFHGIVGACKDAGLTQGQTVTVVGSWQPAVDKYGSRIPEEVARSWAKVADKIPGGPVMTDDMGYADIFTDDEPAKLLDRVAAWMRRYLAVPSEHYITVFTLWAAHTWTVEAFYVTPRLIVDSAEPESGKTRVLELLNLICRAPIFTMNTTIAALYRRLNSGPRTILLDETDAVFAKGAAQNHEDLRALLDSGYKRGATVDRCVGEGTKMEVKEFPAFAPAALAGIAGNMPDTITTRAVTLTMRRRSPEEEIDEFIEEDILAEAEPMRTAMEVWATDATGKLRGARPVMPDGVRDRKAEIWRALLAVADEVGGVWPDRAREACRHFVLDAKVDDGSIGVRLLVDLLEVFRDQASGDIAPAMATERILDRLNAMEESPWGNWYSRTGKPMDARGLAKLLKRYSGADGKPIKPGTIRIGEDTPKGYRRQDLWDPWTRYGVFSSSSATYATNATPLIRHVADVPYVAHTGTGSPGSPDDEDREEASHASHEYGQSQDEKTDPTHCEKCGQTFMITAPGKTRCERCKHDPPSCHTCGKPVPAGQAYCTRQCPPKRNRRNKRNVPDQHRSGCSTRSI